jgi:NADPH:quinone reductase-like Zn-dependent oxidoreductase
VSPRYGADYGSRREDFARGKIVVTIWDVKAVVYSQYGSPDVLRLADVPTPVPKDDEILIRIHAVSLNRSDWEVLTGTPAYARTGGLRKPGRAILGSDIAGRVEAVGTAHTEFQPGDDVYGDIMATLGGFAEYVCVRGRNVVRKPEWMSYEQAATIPQAGVIAMRGICVKGQAQPGERVLINGAGGGSGMFAIQLAKLQGADVTAVDNGGKLDFMRAMGADRVIDYTREDFTTGEPYDLILDLAAQRSVFASARALRPGGRYYAVGGALGTLLQIFLVAPWLTRRGGRRIRLLIALPNKKDITAMAALCESGAIRIAIDRVYPLAEVPEALRYLGEGRAKGKVVITVA